MIELLPPAGMNERGSPFQLDLHEAAELYNCDLYRDTLKARESLYWTSYEGPGGRVRRKFFLKNEDGTVTVLWWEDGTVISGAPTVNLYKSENPQQYHGLPTGTLLDGGLSHTTYPQHWLSADWVSATQLHSTVFFVNGRSCPMIYHQQSGLSKWTPFQPRSFYSGLQIAAGAPPVYAENSVDQQGGVVGQFLSYSPVKYAFTYVNKNHPDYPESNPIQFDYGSAREYQVTGVAPLPIGGTIRHLPWIPGGGIRLMRFQFARPVDPQVTHIRIYRTLHDGTTFCFMYELEIPAAGVIDWFADGANPDHLHLYGDDRIKNQPKLEFDHFGPPCLGFVFEHRDYIFGVTRWEPSMFPGNRSTDATAAAATVDAVLVPWAGYYITIVPSAAKPWLRGGEWLIGASIRLTLGSNRPYQIEDWVESSQRILIGHPLGFPDTVFDKIETADIGLTLTDFVIEMPSSRLYWSEKGRPFRWNIRENYRFIGEDDGEEVQCLGAAESILVLPKKNRAYALSWDSSPAVGYGSSLKQISNSYGVSSPNGLVSLSAGLLAMCGQKALCKTDGVSVERMLAKKLPLNLPTVLASVNYHERSAVMFFMSGQTYVVQYEGEERYSKYFYAHQIYAASRGLDAFGFDKIFLAGTSDLQCVLIDGTYGAGRRGQADGHSIEPTVGVIEFFPTARPTSPSTVAGEIIDTKNVFPDNAAGGGKILKQAVRIVGGFGAGAPGSVGIVTARTSATVLQTSMTVLLDETSVYQIGYVDWYMRTGFLRSDQTMLAVREVHLMYVPQSKNAGNEAGRRHDHWLYVRTFQGVEQRVDGTFIPRLFVTDVEEGFNPDRFAGPLIRTRRRSDRWEVNYTNSLFDATSADFSKAREDPNPGSAFCSVFTRDCYVAIEVGEQGVFSAGEIISIGLVTDPTVDK